MSKKVKIEVGEILSSLPDGSFRARDFAYLRRLILIAIDGPDDDRLMAILSNNFNIILAALAIAESHPKRD